ncbi:MAG TPA: DUF2752 domain-containing protein [Blastocatellia bacterium]|jgi:hypothetical protein|nr:DUF2752 domain-containing protein [Blastocatellia bacterium]
MEAATDHVKTGPQASYSEPDRSRRVALAVLAGLSIVYLFSIFYSPAEPGPDGRYFTICAFKNATGLPCPGCGLTHSFCAVGKGDLSSAARFNLMGPPIFLLSTLYWLRSALFLAGWKEKVRAFDTLVARFRVARVFLISLLVFGVGRILFLLLQ